MKFLSAGFCEAVCSEVDTWRFAQTLADLFWQHLALNFINVYSSGCLLDHFLGPYF